MKGIDIIMIDKHLIGTKKEGCFIDNTQEMIIYYENLSLYEKLSKKQSSYTIHYKDILTVSIGYNVSKGFELGTTSLFINLFCLNNKTYLIPILFFETTKDQIRDFIKVLKASPLEITDQYRLLDTILESDQTVGTIICEIDYQNNLY